MRNSVIRTHGSQEIAGMTADNIYHSTIRIEQDNMRWAESPKKAVWDSLTEEDKNDIIEVDGHKYIRKMYEVAR